VKPKPGIFALARAPQKLPLAELVEQLKEFKAPAIADPALIAAAEARKAAGEAQVAATKNLGTILAAAREAEGLGKGVSYPSITKAQAALIEADVALTRAREAEEVISLPYRQEFARQAFAASMPVRDALHGMISELDSAAEALRMLAALAVKANSGAPWICRNAEDLLVHIEYIRSILETDSKLMSKP
jgi:hypothetical protein